MAGRKSHRSRKRDFPIGEESSEYWDSHDSSEILETGERVKLKIARPGHRCTTCGSSRLRKRMIDLPVLDGTVVFKKIRILSCADCRTSLIEKESLEELRDKLHRLASKLDTRALFGFVRERLVSYETKWSKKAKGRKVISVYWPRRDGTPAKAQISLAVSDPLYSRLLSLRSEDIRKIVGLRYFEDLERKAKKQNRTISQYLKLELAKRILDR